MPEAKAGDLGAGVADLLMVGAATHGRFIGARVCPICLCQVGAAGGYGIGVSGGQENRKRAICLMRCGIFFDPFCWHCDEL